MGQGLSSDVLLKAAQKSQAYSNRQSPESNSRDRAVAAIMGAFVADAATMPLHWIYDQALIENILKRSERLTSSGLGPEFFHPPQTPFYSYEVGTLSPYGDETEVILRSMASRGYFDVEEARQEMYKFCATYKGRLNRASQKFLELRDSGLQWEDCAVADDTQFLSMKIPLIVARYAGSSMMLDKLDAATRLYQTNEKCIAATRLGAKLLEKVILGMKIQDAFRWARQCESLTPGERDFLMGLESFGPNGGNMPYSAAVEQHGLSAALPGSFRASLYALKVFAGYEVAIRANISAGGDNVCRAWFIGAMLCAEQGEGAIPKSWKKRTHQYSELRLAAESLAGSNVEFQTIERKCRMPIPGFL